MEYGYRVLNCGLSTYALYGLDNNLLGFLAGGHLGVIHNLVDIRCCLGLGLLLE